MEGEDEIEVYVIMEDVDSDKVMKTFEERYPEEYDTYMRAKYDPIDSDIIPTIEGDVELKEGEEGASLVESDINDEVLQKGIEVKREICKEYYAENNFGILEKYCGKEAQMFVSSYAPMAILNISKDTVMEMEKDGRVLGISKFINIKDSNEDLELANEITRADYVRDTYGNSGSGVKIGQIELSIPDVDDELLGDANIITNRRNDDFSVAHRNKTHAARVAKILVGTDNNGGNDGLAPDAALYSVTYEGESDFYGGIEWLVDSGVNVINMSAGVDRDGTYDIRSIWAEHIAAQHDIHFVKAAGNNYVDITSPGLAYNVITVGAVDNNGSDAVSGFTIWSGSNYREASSVSEKPNLVAPAMNFWNDSGTSYAAPQVAGTIAQLCSYNSALKVKQTAIGAILAASSAEKVEAVGNGAKGDSFITSVRINSNPQISDKEGAGILDSRWARGIVYYGNYWSYTINKGSFPYNKYVQINASENSVTRIAIFWLKRNSITNHATGSEMQIAMTDLNLYVYDPNGNIVGYSSTDYGNFEIVQFTPTMSGSYKIQIRANNCIEKDHVGIAVW